MLNQHSDKVANLYADTRCGNRQNGQPSAASLDYSGTDRYNHYHKSRWHQHNDFEALQ